MLPLALDGVSLAALSRVQPYVAAVGEAGEEVSAMLKKACACFQETASRR